MTEVFKNNKRSHLLFKYVFNLSPMYRRTTGKVLYVSHDFKKSRLRIKKNYKNLNYAGTIFGGSMFSALDPIPFVMLTQIIGNGYIVWDKSAEIRFISPGIVDLYADVEWTDEEIHHIKEQVSLKNEMTVDKTTILKNKEGSKVYCEVTKTIYIANKNYYKQKKKDRQSRKQGR